MCKKAESRTLREAMLEYKRYEKGYENSEKQAVGYFGDWQSFV